MADTPTLRYLTVAFDSVWDELVAMYAARGVDVLPIPSEGQDPEIDGTYYFLAPKVIPGVTPSG